VDGTEYFANVDGKTLVAGKAYRITATLKQVFSNDGKENGLGWVDFGLPSKLKWANKNVGAASTSDYGGYYAWGETKAYGEVDETNLVNYNYKSQRSYLKTYYHWMTYKWCDGTNSTITKYNCRDSYGTYDGKKSLEPEDDAARVNCGGNWRMPTNAEQEELVNACYWVWTDNYKNTGVPGYIAYKALDSDDAGVVVGKENSASSGYSLESTHVFFPAAGYMYLDEKYFEGEYGGYWSSDVDDDRVTPAWEFVFYSSENQLTAKSISNRYAGQNVRAVFK
jgi:hypothetical protein